MFPPNGACAQYRARISSLVHWNSSLRAWVISISFCPHDRSGCPWERRTTCIDRVDAPDTTRPARKVLPHGSEHSPQIYAMVFPEALVFKRHNGLDEFLRKAVRWWKPPLFVGRNPRSQEILLPVVQDGRIGSIEEGGREAMPPCREQEACCTKENEKPRSPSPAQRRHGI